MNRIELDATQEKNSKGSVLPLNSDLANDLRLWLADMLERDRRKARGQDGESIPMDGIPKALPADRLLFTVPAQLVKALDRDLAAAGIAKEDERGRTIDVHAMRHTHCTMLSRSGVAPRTAQAAMRHSKIDLTMRVYTDETQLAVRDAVESLPQLEAMEPKLPLQKTGTEGTEKVAIQSYIESYISDSHLGAKPCHSVQSSRLKQSRSANEKTPFSQGKTGFSVRVIEGLEPPTSEPQSNALTN